MSKVLTALEAAFVAAMTADPSSGEQAAIRAGYKASGARRCATRLLSKPHIVEALAEHQAAAFKAAEIDLERVLKEIGRIAFVDIRKLFHDNGTLREITELDDDTAAALAGVDVERRTERGQSREEDVEYTTKKFKLAPKLEALEKLMKRLNAYPAAKAPVGPDGKVVTPAYIMIPAKDMPGASVSRG